MLLLKTSYIPAHITLDSYAFLAFHNQIGGITVSIIFIKKLVMLTGTIIMENVHHYYVFIVNMGSSLVVYSMAHKYLYIIE